MLTRRQLNRLRLPAGTIDAVLRLHEQEVTTLRDQCSAFRRVAEEADACRRERDELKARLDEALTAKGESELRLGELTAWREQAENDARRAQAAQALRSALLEAGANPKAVPLLLRAVDMDTLPHEDAAQPDAVLIDGLRRDYADFFAQPQQLPTPVIDPPSGMSGPLDAEAIRAMDAGQINANWPAVKAMLAQPDN